jgi:hypothetical protein
MELSPSREVASCAATQEFPKSLSNLTVQYCVHKNPHGTLSWARSTQSVASNPISLRSILTLFTQLFPGLPSGLFPSGFPTNNL